MKTVVITVSDGVSQGTRADGGGAAVSQTLVDAGFDIVDRMVVPDDQTMISSALTSAAGRASLVVTTGGTGFGPRDVTPEATRQVVEREGTGLELAMLLAGLRSTPMAALSRSVVGSVGSTLIVNLPGNPRGAVENLEAIIGLIPHLLDLLRGETRHQDDAEQG